MQCAAAAATFTLLLLLLCCCAAVLLFRAQACPAELVRTSTALVTCAGRPCSECDLLLPNGPADLLLLRTGLVDLGRPCLGTCRSTAGPV
jgi:hypothetical protein